MGAVPLMLIPLIIYLVSAFFLYDHANYIVSVGEVAPHPFWDSVAADIILVSGQYFPLTYSDVLVTIALIMMLVSLLISSSAYRTTVVGNMVMVLTLCAFIVLFLVVDECGTTTFFILTMIALVDTLARVALSIVATHSAYRALPED